MRTPGQVAQKMKQAQFRHIKREISRLLKQTPPNCKLNRTLDLDIGPVGVCSLDCEVCDPRFKDRSSECGKWEARHQKDSIKSSLKDFFKSRPPADIAVRFPDVAALLWVLEDERPSLSEEVPEDESLQRVLERLLGLTEGSTRSAVVEAVQKAVQDAQTVRREWDSQAEETESLRKQLREKTQEIDDLQERSRQALSTLESKPPEQAPWWRRWLPWG
jgi:hypothetical protein